MSDRIIQRNDTAANWQSVNPILAQGELGIVIDGAKGYKIGDGVTPWNDLPYPANPSNIVQTTGNSETAVMSQKAITDLYNKGYRFLGVATPESIPESLEPYHKVFYITNTVGTYTNFNNIVVNDGEIAILLHNGNWSKVAFGGVAKKSEVEKQNIIYNTLRPYLNIPKYKYWTWETTFHTVGYHRVISTFGANKLYIKRGADNFYIHIVKSYHFYNAGEFITDYATGESGRYISDNSLLEVSLPFDAKYVIIGVTPADSDLEPRTPSVLRLDDYDVLLGTIKHLRDSVGTSHILDNAISTSKLQDSSVSSVKIAPNSVNDEKIANTLVVEKPSKNLFNSNDLLNGRYFKSDGSTAGGTSDMMITNRFVPLKPSTTYCFTNDSGTYVGRIALYFVFYDENKEFIESLESTNGVFTTPNTCKYGKFSVYAPNMSYAQLEEGGSRTVYEEYTPINYHATIGTNRLKDKAVTPEKTSFFDISKNLFDYRTVSIGYYINGVGNKSSNLSYSCSDFISVDPTKWKLTSNIYGIEGAYNCFYDSSKNFITAFQSVPIVIPSNAAYVRFSFFTNKVSVLKTVQIEYGTENTEYEDYKNEVSREYIPDIDNEIIVPKYAYLLSDVNNDIFYEPILKKWNPYRYDVFANTLPNSRNYVRATKRGVKLNNPTATSIVLSLYDTERAKFTHSKELTFRKGTSGVGTNQIKVGIIGDSYTDGGGFTPALLAQNYVPNIKLVGTRQVYSYNTQFTDGRSGWTLETFSNPQTRADYFNPFVHPQGIHRFWGNTAFWAGVCSESPGMYQSRYTQYISLFDVTGWPVSPSDGDVIYDSENSTFKEYNNGSWTVAEQIDYTWEFNYSKYLSMWNIETPDILCVMLGVNDFWINNEPTKENLSIWRDRMNAIEKSFHDVNSSGKFVILTANTVTYHNPLHYRPLDVHDRMQTLRQFVIDNWDEKESSNIYVVDTAQLIDSENAFILTEAIPFDGYSETNKEVYAVDGQHPRLNYTTLGYSLAAFIQYMR